MLIRATKTRCIPCEEARIKQRPRGLGDALKGFFELLGIPACAGCAARAARLNKIWSFADEAAPSEPEDIGNPGPHVGDIGVHPDPTGRLIPNCPSPDFSWDDIRKKCIPPPCNPDEHWDVAKRRCIPNCDLGEFWDETLPEPKCVLGKLGSFALVFESTDKPSNFDPSVPGFAQFQSLQRKNRGTSTVVGWFAIVDQVTALNAGNLPWTNFRPTRCQAYIDSMEGLTAEWIGLAGCGSEGLIPLPGRNPPRDLPEYNWPLVDDDLSFTFYAPKSAMTPVWVLTGAEANAGRVGHDINEPDSAGIWSVEIARIPAHTMPIRSRVYDWPGTGVPPRNSQELVVMGDGPSLPKGGYMEIVVTGSRTGNCPDTLSLEVTIEEKRNGQFVNIEPAAKCVDGRALPADIRITIAPDLRAFPSGSTARFEWLPSVGATITRGRTSAAVEIRATAAPISMVVIIEIGACRITQTIPVVCPASTGPADCPKVAPNPAVAVSGCIGAGMPAATVNVTISTNMLSATPRGTYTFTFSGPQASDNQTMTTQDVPSITASFQTPGPKTVQVKFKPSDTRCPETDSLSASFVIPACAPPRKAPTCCSGGKCVALGIALSALVAAFILAIYFCAPFSKLLETFGLAAAILGYAAICGWCCTRCFVLIGIALGVVTAIIVALWTWNLPAIACILAGALAVFGLLVALIPIHTFCKNELARPGKGG